MNRRIFGLLFIVGFFLLSIGGAKAWADAATDNPIVPNEDRLYQLFQGHLNTLTIFVGLILGGFAILQVIIQLKESRQQATLRQQAETTIKQSEATIKQHDEKSRENALQLKELAERAIKQTEAATAEMRNLMQWSMRQSETNQNSTNTVMQRVAELIGSMKNMTDLATQSQTMALKVKEDLEKNKDEKSRALQELSDKVRPLAEGKDTRFNRAQQHSLSETFDDIWHVQATYGARRSEMPAAVHLVRGYYYSVITGNYRRGNDEFDKVITDPKASDKQREIAYYNRGINQANLRQYDQAIEDFRKASALNETNLFYRFYQLDTALLKARDGNGAAADLVADFRRLVEDIRKADDSLCEPLGRGKLLARALLSYASLLVFNAGDFATARSALQENEVRDDLFAQYMALAANEKEGTPLDSKAVAACLEKAKEEHRSAIEPRARLLRGMILQQCYRWSGGSAESEVRTLRPQLLADVASLEKQGGTLNTVFSPLTQKNEPLNKIREQVS